MGTFALPQEQSRDTLRDVTRDIDFYTCSICGIDLYIRPHIHTIDEHTGKGVIHMADNETSTLSTKDVAEELETDGRTLRKFLRAEAKANGGEVGVDTPGKGKRYAFEQDQIAGLRDRFAAWNDARNAPEDEESDDDVEEV